MTATRRLWWLLLFAVAFGWVEAAVVIYLRRLYYPDGFAFPLRMIEPQLLGVELAREAATLLMLLGVACLAGRRLYERLAFYAFAFGIWDLAYYGGLKIALDWPVSLADWDILFLLPLPWVAPVYAPMSIALVMILAGVSVVQLESRGYPCRVDLAAWLLGLVGVGILLYSFMRDTDAGLRGALPAPYPVSLLLAGDALLVAACVRVMWLSRLRGSGFGFPSSSPP
jgi:hypothetical protein